MQLQRFLHAGLVVTDLARAEWFYGTVLGLPKSPNRPLNFAGTWFELGEMQLHLMLVNDWVNDTQKLEVWGRSRHLAFRVESLLEAKAQLEAYGCAYQLSKSGRPALFVKDPDGNIIELGEV